MTGHDVVFVVVGLLTAGAAVLTVTSKNLMHAALFFAVTLGGIAGVFLTLAADFLALVQIVVYVGAVAVLFMFGLMLTRAPIGREALDGKNRGLAMVVAGGLFVVLTTLLIGAFGDLPTVEVTGPRIDDLGIAIFADWVLPFEVLSMLLLAALIGAIVLARRESGEELTVTRIQMAEDRDPDALEGEQAALTGGSGGTGDAEEEHA